MRRGAVRLAGLALVCTLTAGCPGSPDRAAPQTAVSPQAREYWPTAGWRTDAPADHGLDAGELAEVERLVSVSYTNVRSIVIVRNGYLVYERYWQGTDARTGHDVRSVTKSVVGALVGIALGEGRIESLDQTVPELLPDHLPADADPRWGEVTLTRLLTMTSGLAGDDGAEQAVTDAMWESPDWVRHILGRRLATDPGTAWAYSNATSHLLSAIVAEATGRSTLAYARERLFGPLGIATDGAVEPVLGGPPGPAADRQIALYRAAPVAWPRDPQGYHFGAALLKLPARDLAKLGFLYLNEGRWEDEQIVPADYVTASTARRQRTADSGASYGWHWWVPGAVGDGSFFARGLGGQLVYVDRSLDLVAVVTGDPEIDRGDVSEFVQHAIVAAAGD